MTQTKYRTHTCGELRMENVGQTVTVAGWLENLREVGSNLGFLVLRDMHGVTQVVIETEEMMAQVKAINKESVLAVTGAVRERAQQEPQAAHRRHRGGAQRNPGAGPLPPQRAAL